MIAWSIGTGAGRERMLPSILPHCLSHARAITLKSHQLLNAQIPTWERDEKGLNLRREISSPRRKLNWIFIKRGWKNLKRNCFLFLSVEREFVNKIQTFMGKGESKISLALLRYRITPPSPKHPHTCLDRRTCKYLKWQREIKVAEGIKMDNQLALKYWDYPGLSR